MDVTVNLTYTDPQLEIFDATEKYVLITKGRRFGLTKGFTNYAIECMLEGQRCLWGDTIHPNIDRYVERYFLPELKSNHIDYHWNAQKKLISLPLSNGYTDFRSADKPENWEGFGYNKIFLNEAGIILKNDYLYTNAVLPMLIDYPNTQLFAGGVPKGKFGKGGKMHRFYELCTYASQQKTNYRIFQFSTYDNPLLTTADVQELEQEIERMNPAMVQQEIYGEFVDGAAGLLWDATLIERQRVKVAPFLKRVVVAIDPAVSNNKNSDETGIVVCGLDIANKGYILEDISGKYSPDEWALKAKESAEKWGSSAYIAEKNQGGDMVLSILRQYDKQRRVKLVQASKGKFTRAEPVYTQYEQGNVFHVGHFSHLENQMINFNPDGGGASPDRVDALVWGLTELMVHTPTAPQISFNRMKKVR